MNKKQLTVVWIIGISLSIVVFTADYSLQSGIETLIDKHPLIISEHLFKYGVPILIIGGLLIYTFRSKKR